MKKLALFLLVLVVFVLIAGGVGAWWLQGYFGSEKFKNTLEQKFSEALNTSFSVEHLAFDPLSGFTLEKVQITDPPPHNGENFLTIEDVKLHYDPWGLLNRKVLLHKLELQKPIAALRFYPDGGWNLPRLAAAAPKNGIWMNLEELALQLEITLNEYRIQKGEFQIINAEKKNLCHLHGVDLNGDYKYGVRGAEAHGKLTVDAFKLYDLFEIKDLKSSLSYLEGKLTLPDLNGQAYGGKATGLAELNLVEESPSFRLNLKLTEVDLMKLGKAVREKADWAEGELEMNADLKGALSNPLGLSGSGEFDLKKTRLTKFAWIRELAQTLWIPELEKMEFEHIQGTFKVEDQKITFYNIEALAEPLEVTGTGTIGFDRQISFDVGLALSPKLCESMPKEIIAQLPTRQDQYRTLTFHVFGTLSQPKTNLTEKLARSALQQGVEKLGSELENKLKEKSPKLYQILFPSRQPSNQSAQPAHPIQTDQPAQSTPSSESTPSSLQSTPQAQSSASSASSTSPTVSTPGSADSTNSQNSTSSLKNEETKPENKNNDSGSQPKAAPENSNSPSNTSSNVSTEASPEAQATSSSETSSQESAKTASAAPISEANGSSQSVSPSSSESSVSEATFSTEESHQPQESSSSEVKNQEQVSEEKEAAAPNE